MLRSDLCDYCDVSIVVKGTIDLSVDAANENHKVEKYFFLKKNNAPFISGISKINSTLIDNAEDLDIVMPMYNPLQYSQNYSMTSRSLWSYYRDKTDDVDDVSDGKSFNYKTKIVENKPKGPGNEGHANRPPVLTLNAEVTIPLKYFSNFWRSFDFSLINYEIGLDLSWTKDCLVIEQNSTKQG